jgi:hypothetical protein
MRRLALILIVVAVFLPTAPLADPGNGKGGSSGGPPGAGAGPHGNGPGGDNGKGPGANGKGPGKGETDPGVPPTAPAANDQTIAHDALENGATLPLATILRAAIKVGGGRLIDARLFIINKTPIYRLTLIDSQGVTRQVYYDARNAQPLGPP